MHCSLNDILPEIHEKRSKKKVNFGYTIVPAVHRPVIHSLSSQVKMSQTITFHILTFDWPGDHDVIYR